MAAVSNEAVPTRAQRVMKRPPDGTAENLVLGFVAIIKYR